MKMTELWATPIAESHIENYGDVAVEMFAAASRVDRGITGPDFNFADYFKGNAVLEQFLVEITEAACEYTQTYLSKDVKLKRCWLSFENQGDMTNPHIHYGSVVSSVFYLQVPEGAGNLFLYDPRGGDPHWGSVPWKLIEAEAGKLLLFPSYLLHSTKANMSRNTRFAFAADFTFKE